MKLSYENSCNECKALANKCQWTSEPKFRLVRLLASIVYRVLGYASAMRLCCCLPFSSLGRQPGASPICKHAHNISQAVKNLAHHVKVNLNPLGVLQKQALQAKKYACQCHQIINTRIWACYRNTLRGQGKSTYQCLFF